MGLLSKCVQKASALFAASETNKLLFTILNLRLHFPFVASVWKTEQWGDFANIAKE